jgi:hypothetical protein
MAESKCNQCSWRAKFDDKPKSFLGRLWRWHINWCPGWKAFMKSLPEDKQSELRANYKISAKKSF